MKHHSKIAYVAVISSIVIVIALCMAVPVYSQGYWTRAYGDAQNEIPYSFQQTNDGGFIIAGSTRSFGVTWDDFWIVKTDGTGEIIWQKTYGDLKCECPRSIQQTSDGGYIVAGERYTYGMFDNDIVILKLDASGSVVWQKMYAGTGTDIPYAIEQTGDGGYIVAGDSNSFGAEIRDAWVFKLDASGNVTWQWAFGGSATEGARSIHQTSDGGYIVAGEAWSVSTNGYDMWIFKINSSGEMNWQKSYGGSLNDYAASIQQTSDGGYVVAGRTMSFGSGNFDFWILKLDSLGVITWQKTYGGDGLDRAEYIQQTSDGGYIVTGTSESFPEGQAFIWLLKLDASGNVTWQKYYGSAYSENGISVLQNNDGGYIVLGGTNNLGPSYQDYLLLKVDAQGSIDSTCNFIYSSNLTPSDTAITFSMTSLPYYNTSATVTDTSFTISDSSGTSPLICQSKTTLVSHKPAIDDSAGATPNGVIETDETVELIGNVENTGVLTAQSVTGTLYSGDPIVINDSSATYPDIAPGTIENSLTHYSVTAPSANRPSTHWDFDVTESPGCFYCNPASYDFSYHVGNSFADVQPSYLFYYFIETLLHSGVTAGCTASTYCPDMNVSRAQMAKFICAAMEMKTPGSCITSGCTDIFTDVPGSNIFCPHIEALYNAGIVSGCSSNPLMYCPDVIMERQAMAKFICLAMAAAVPGSCTTAACADIFADVSAGNIFCSFIEGVYNAGVVSGCQTTPLMYCPLMTVTRAQMSKFIINAFGFSLY